MRRRCVIDAGLKKTATQENARSLRLNHNSFGSASTTYELRYEDLATMAFTKTEPLTLNEVQVEGGVKFSHLKVTLYKVQNGNMKTQSIAKGEFDD